MMNKGFAGLVVMVIAGAVLSVLAIMIMILPVLTLRVHFIETVNFENNYNNAQLGLTALLATTDKSGNSVRDLVTNYVVEKDSASLDAVKSVAKDKLDKLKQSGTINCYELKIGEDIIVSKQNCETKYSARTLVAAPYGDYTKIISLAIG